MVLVSLRALTESIEAPGFNSTTTWFGTMSWGESPAAVAWGPGATINPAITINAAPAILIFFAFLKSTLLRLMISNLNSGYMGQARVSLTVSPPTRQRHNHSLCRGNQSRHLLQDTLKSDYRSRRTAPNSTDGRRNP